MKRNLFTELKEGFDALEANREGKLTLRHHAAEKLPAPEITAEELLSLRERLHLSRALFARYLRTNTHSGKLGTRPRPTQCASGFADTHGRALPGYGRAVGGDLKP